MSVRLLHLRIRIFLGFWLRIFKITLLSCRIIVRKAGVEMARVTLESSDTIKTPYLVASLMVAYEDAEDNEVERSRLLQILVDGFSCSNDREMSKEIYKELLLGNIPYTVNSGKVIFDTRDQRV